MYSDNSPLHSPALPPFHQSGSDGEISREGSTMGKYGYGNSESALHLPKEEAGYGSPLRQSTNKPSGIAGWSLRKKILIGGGAIVAVIVLAGVLGGVFGRSDDSDSSSSGSASSDKSSEAPADNDAAQKAGEGGDGTTITMEYVKRSECYLKLMCYAGMATSSSTRILTVDIGSPGHTTIRHDRTTTQSL